MDLKGVLIFVLTLSVSGLVFSIFKDLLHKNITLLGYYVASAFIATYIILKLVLGAKSSASSRFRHKRTPQKDNGGFEIIADDVLNYSPLTDKSKKEEKHHRWRRKDEKKDIPHEQPVEGLNTPSDDLLDLFGESSNDESQEGVESKPESIDLELSDVDESDVVFCPNGDIVERKDLIKKDGKLYCPVCNSEISSTP